MKMCQLEIPIQDATLPYTFQEESSSERSRNMRDMHETY